jgi:phage nucleotide-binding protein
MAINLKSTSDVSAENGVKMLVYGQAGAGKTSLIPTLPAPIILSAEAGLLSIADAGLPYIEVTSIAMMHEAYEWLIGSDEAAQFQSVALDSISEIAEVCLASEKAKTKDPRAAYGEMQTAMADIVRKFRDLPRRHVYMCAKLDKSQDEMGRMLYSPSMPGQRAGQAIPYQFDIVAALRIYPDAEGNHWRGLMLESDGLWQAKDRSGKLDGIEPPDLGAIISKIGGNA